MHLIKFQGHNVVFAKDQPEYMPLPALRVGGLQGEIICCWQLSWRERLRMLVTGKIWHSVLTFQQPLQPQLLMVDQPVAVKDAASHAREAA